MGRPIRCLSTIRNLYQLDSRVISHTYSRIRPQIFFGSSNHLFTKRRQSIRLRVVVFQERILVENSEKAVERVSSGKIIGDRRQELWKEN